MLVVEVDGFDSETAQAGFAGLADVVGLAADAANVGIFGIADDTELRREHDFVAAALDGASDQLFVLMRAVDVGGVEEEDSEVECAVNRGDGFGVVESGVELRHTHAAEAFGGNLEASVAEKASFHDHSLRDEVRAESYFSIDALGLKDGARKSSSV